ncbi:hypothetical protein D3OALGB2SA_4194 [Olavius algarvensis associated proteobacterium Delta 3]|nr:hypothetical protein D3OALGB2SA_4194 [Olavius algarvensis associated proteobacterium Delta 3]
MTRSKTKEKVYVRLPEQRIQEIEELVASWPYETKSFMRSRLNQYKPPSNFISRIVDSLQSLFMAAPDRTFQILKDPDILTDWQRRFEISGQTNPQDAWGKILEKEVSSRDYAYLLSLLEKELTDVHVPWELRNLFEKIYRSHIRKEYLSDPEVPKAPLVLITGPSGSGKTSTLIEAVEAVIFGNEVLPEIDLGKKKEELLADEPFWKSLDDVNPGLSMEMDRRKKLKFYKSLTRIPLLRRILKRQIGRNLSKLEEQGVMVDYTMVTPNDYQTALAGEPGNYFKKAMGDPQKTSIRHIEEAHSAFGKADGRQSGVERQQRTLIDTANIVIDEVINGQRDCLLLATTDQPERFDSAIYRRFVEKGVIIEISEYWKNPDNLKEIVRLELQRNDIYVGVSDKTQCNWNIKCISHGDLDHVVERLYTIFTERTLKIIPAYVRKLIQSVIQIKSDFSQDYFSDAVLVRQAFELVAKNSFGDLYKKFVDRMDRQVQWESYVGKVKNTFSEMANNSLYYGVSEEKGVVLNGPPGSGKTFLVRAWLSENGDVHDISASPSALQDPVNPVDGAIENLEKIYDIAKMIAPSVVFFDEGDALAPKRSGAGGSPSDKLTNRFLNIIDGEIPLNRVFTTLTTNRLDILDPALIRSKRLKVLEVSGHLGNDDISEIVKNSLKGVPLSQGLDEETIIESAKGICHTPADYAAFVEKALSLRVAEYEVLQRFRALLKEAPQDRNNFIKFNYKTLLGILDAAGAPDELRSETKKDTTTFERRYSEIVSILKPIQSEDGYPLVEPHLFSARREISESPVKRGKVQLDEFLEAELSQEPQVGFIIGVGANDVSGMLLPIATSLTYGLTAEKVLVTGAVSSASSAAAELDMAVQMTQQSAKEALTMVKNYLQGLAPKISLAKLLGEFLDKYTIHHQLLSASYNVGGPSAGYALALNTLSALLHIPVYNDFGITGAPWTKGVKKGEVGGSVIIGGHKKKTEKVLLHLRRMYMPLQNYKDLEMEFLMAYWNQDKDVLGVTHFGDLVPEVVWLGPDYESVLLDLIQLRIEYKVKKFRQMVPPRGIKEQILSKKDTLRARLESEITDRIDAIRLYLRNPVKDPHLSLQEIFRAKGRKRVDVIRPLADLMEKFRRTRE